MDGVFRCEVNSGLGTTDGQVPNDGPPAGTHRIAYPASVSACVTTEFPGTDFCTGVYTATSLVVTKLDTSTSAPLYTYLRFDLDSAFTTVAAVTLQMTALDTAQAASDQSGTVWQADPFTQQSLDQTFPGKTTMAVLATDRGTVMKGAVVEWSLASSLAAANGVLYLELESASTNNVIYDKSAPPTLLIDVY
ncbi:MAG: hypothetical protein ABI591_19920 [Kofleriaceae bacterium]